MRIRTRNRARKPQDASKAVVPAKLAPQPLVTLPKPPARWESFKRANSWPFLVKNHNAPMLVSLLQQVSLIYRNKEDLQAFLMLLDKGAVFFLFYVVLEATDHTDEDYVPSWVTEAFVDPLFYKAVFTGTGSAAYFPDCCWPSFVTSTRDAHAGLRECVPPEWQAAVPVSWPKPEKLGTMPSEQFKFLPGAYLHSGVSPQKQVEEKREPSRIMSINYKHTVKPPKSPVVIDQPKKVVVPVRSRTRSPEPFQHMAMGKFKDKLVNAVGAAIRKRDRVKIATPPAKTRIRIRKRSR